MSPKCLECGNQNVFTHSVEGHETRYYDPDSGAYLESDFGEMETQQMWCSKCGSKAIRPFP